MSAIDLNTASVDALQEISGIGPVKAAAIVDLQQQGPLTMAKLVQATNKPAEWFHDLAQLGTIQYVSSSTDDAPTTPTTLAHAAEANKRLLAKVRQLEEEQQESERKTIDYERGQRD